MENLKRLQDCNKRNITFRQAFYQLGMTEFDKKIGELNDKEEFSALVNWAMNKLQPFHSMDLRHRVNDEIYQTSIHRSAREIRVGRPTLSIKNPEAIKYC